MKKFEKESTRKNEQKSNSEYRTVVNYRVHGAYINNNNNK